MNASSIIGFITAGILFILGMLIIFDVIFPQSDNSMMKVFGFILIVYGVYRYINTASKVKMSKLEERKEQMEKEKRKFLKND